MHVNILEYWQHLQNLPPEHEDKPTARICRLMTDMFESWQRKSPFPNIGSFGHLRDHLSPEDGDVMSAALPIRRAVAFSKMFDMISGEWGKCQGFCNVVGDELIIGNMPPYSVGQGKEVMNYLKSLEDEGEDEELKFEIGFMNPWSNFGHICPNYEKLVTQGLNAIIEDCESLKEGADETRKNFYDSVIIALKGVIGFAANYANHCDDKIKAFEAVRKTIRSESQKALMSERIETMRSAADRLRRIPAEPCESFLDAVQAIYLMNSALHWTGELSSLGRLDQILQPFLEKDSISPEQAQEVIDCLWVKLDEQVVLDNRLVEDHFTSADGALLGAGGASNFDQGALINQWMQQVTIGGFIANNDLVPKDGCNDVTRMCLNAARKFPFNCPTLDLRVHKNTPKDILELAARAQKSGGAHPILMNDDKLIPALCSSGDVELKSARNYACDGCYETHFPGETEFSFIYIPGLDVLEKALNSGAGFSGSGPMNLRGSKGSFRTAPASEIESFEAFYAILEQHIWLGVNRTLSGLIGAYGSKAGICPTPILSGLIDGCVKSGRDLYDGGARYKMFAPLMTGISTVADSLYVIDKFVFQDTEISLTELVAYLRSDWGTRNDVIGQKPCPEKAKVFRLKCMNAPKFGYGNKAVDNYAWRLADSFAEIINKALDHPIHADGLERLKRDYGSEAMPFNMLITPGIGTFEQYVFGGIFAGATADGRRSSQPVGSDLAAAPYPQDILPPSLEPEDLAEYAESELPEVRLRKSKLKKSLSSWNNKAFEHFSDGAPADFNIGEDFPLEVLIDVLQDFADGKGGNMMTVTTASTEILCKAKADPEFYNLVRVRMGGWTEFFSVLYGAHKEQHLRRPIYLP